MYQHCIKNNSQTSASSSISSIVVLSKLLFVSNERFWAGVDFGNWIVSITELRASAGILFIMISTTTKSQYSFREILEMKLTLRMRQMYVIVLRQIWEAVYAVIGHRDDFGTRSYRPMFQIRTNYIEEGCLEKLWMTGDRAGT